MNNSNSKITAVNVLSIRSAEQGHLIVQVDLNSEIMDFDFYMKYDSKLKITRITRGKNFVELARSNSSFENEIHNLVKKVYSGEIVSFPIKLSFE